MTGTAKRRLLFEMTGKYGLPILLILSIPIGIKRCPLNVLSSQLRLVEIRRNITGRLFGSAILPVRRRGYDKFARLAYVAKKTAKGKI